MCILLSCIFACELRYLWIVSFWIVIFWIISLSETGPRCSIYWWHGHMNYNGDYVSGALLYQLPVIKWEYPRRKNHETTESWIQTATEQITAKPSAYMWTKTCTPCEWLNQIRESLNFAVDQAKAVEFGRQTNMWRVSYSTCRHLIV